MALIQQAILDLENAESQEVVIQSRGIYDAAKRKWKEIEASYRAAELEAVERLGGVDLGDGRRLYVGASKRTKCKDVAAAFEALLDATHGDATAMAEALSANALKPGHCKQVEGFDWDAHFTVEEVKDVKTGKAKREVKLADDRYLSAG